MLRDTKVRLLEIIPGPIDTDMSSHYDGPKTTPPKAADVIWKALLSRKDEVFVGISSFAMFMTRVLPGTVFKSLNDGECKAAEKAAMGLHATRR